jgi:hypothetical protein
VLAALTKSYMALGGEGMVDVEVTVNMAAFVAIPHDF